MLLGGTTNDINPDYLRHIIDELSYIAPIGMYSGSDSEDIHEYFWHNTNLTWLKTGSYQEKLGGLTSPQTNQRFYKKNIHICQDRFGDVHTIYEKEDLTHLFREAEQP